MRLTFRLLCFVSLVLSGSFWAQQNRAETEGSAARTNSSKIESGAGPANVPDLFRRGQEELNHGQLDSAERDFRKVLVVNPREGGAYANLGVVYMRRKQWTEGLTNLRHAERLLPNMPGIRLNIGLAYFRQNEFLKAIPPFESVVRDQPDALQPRYLLGLCYFFAERWKDATSTLEPLWEQESGQPSYLYVLTIAAHRAGEKELDDKALSQLVKVGADSPEVHLFLGKAHLNLEQYDLALSDFKQAAKADPKLPFIHFNLGLTYLKKQDYENARDEFLKDAANEPDVALNFEQLGDVYTLMQEDANAEKAYRQALKLDARLVNSQLGLAKVYQREEKYAQSLKAANAAVALAPDRTDIHYLRGQTLLHLGQKEAGRKELQTAVRLDNERRAQREKQVQTGTVPSPELLQDQPPNSQ
ncbi:MAG TPA: tetratricopeptide repeat protein [Candidatus Sulfotelmatobacter sp.]